MKNILEQMKADAKDMKKRMPAPKQETPVEDKLVQAINDHLEQKSKPFFKKKKGFSPSETNNCARRMVYMFRGVEMIPTTDGRAYRIFDTGHDFHARMTRYFREMKILIGEEVKVSYADPPIPVAYIDAIIRWEDKKSIVELKSIGEDGFAYRKTFNKPKDDHVQQVRIYMRLTKIEDAYIIYENKNTQEILVFKVEQDEEEINKLFKKWSKTYKMYTDGDLPKRPVRSPESKKCTYCELKAMCWSDKDDGV